VPSDARSHAINNIITILPIIKDTRGLIEPWQGGGFRSAAPVLHLRSWIPASAGMTRGGRLKGLSMPE